MTAPMAVGRMAMQGEDESKGPPAEMMGGMMGGEVEGAKPEQTCPKCGEVFATQTEAEGGEGGLTPSQQDDVKSWFESSRPDAAMRAAGR